MIQIPEITISYRNFSLTIDSISLSTNEILGIFGKSGAGKTSYLKRIREHFDAPKAHYMSQFDSLLEEITVRQNIELALTSSGKPKAEIKKWEVDHAEMLTEFEVAKFLEKYPYQLSGGQRKRVELVRFLMMEPEILLLDEPFVGIGHLFESVATKYIIARAQKGHGSTMIVSHDFDLLCKFSKRVMLVDDQGVIGFVPVNDPAWTPQNVRTAWALGVENIIPGHISKALQFNSPTQIIEPNSFISFWGWKANWQSKNETSADIQFSIPRKAIKTTRTYLLHGTLYTQAFAEMNGAKEPISLVGKGTIQDNENAILAVSDIAVIANNT